MRTAPVCLIALLSRVPFILISFERIDQTCTKTVARDVTNLVTCSQTPMSSERDPLLVTPSQHHANGQNLEEVREVKALGPLEISRSNRWAILGGIWIANFLGVRRTISCLIHFSKGLVTLRL